LSGRSGARGSAAAHVHAPPDLLHVLWAGRAMALIVLVAILVALAVIVRVI
jgi:hypothetical protein